MVLEKYKRWPFAIIDDEGVVWRRSRIKGWFMWKSGSNKSGLFACHKYLTHPSFIGCKKIMTKKELNTLKEQA